MIFEEKFIFFPSRYPSGDWRPAGLNFEDAYFDAADGVRLHGWYCPQDRARWTILMSHGNAGHLAHRAWEIGEWQRRLRVAVFIYDYRGFGRSEGRPNEKGVYADARAAYQWLTTVKKVPADEIVLRGESIGCAVSLQLGVEAPCRAIIMESPFTSAVEMGKRSFPWLPVDWIMRNRFDNLGKIEQYQGPLLIVHGTDDSIVPFDMGRRLYERANEPKRLHAVRGADHNDILSVAGESYFEAIDQFLADLVDQAEEG